MIENILTVIKDQVLPIVNKNTEIPQDKKNAVVETTTSSFLDGLKDQLIPDGSITGGLMSMLGGGGANNAIQNFGNSAMTKSIESTISSALTSKVGLNSQLSSTIAASVVPLIMNLIKKQATNKDSSGLDLGAIIGMLTGGKDAKKDDGGLLDTLGGLFGK